MPLRGVTKQWNSLICCNILSQTSVKSYFHKRGRELYLLREERDFCSEWNQGGVCAPSYRQPLCGVYFHAEARFCLPAERRYYRPSFSKLLRTWQFIFCIISQKSIRSCKDKYQIALANWCSLGGTPLIMLSWGVGESCVGLPSKSSCINKITRWSMNEFTAGSAFITHGSAGSGSTGLYQTSRGVSAEIPVVGVMCLLN